jgi:hypothetical protein
MGVQLDFHDGLSHFVSSCHLPANIDGNDRSR